MKHNKATINNRIKTAYISRTVSLMYVVRESLTDNFITENKDKLAAEQNAKNKGYVLRR